MGTQSSKVIRASKMASSGDIQQFIKEAISQEKVVVFSKSYCPYCTLAKEVFAQVKQPFKVYELDQREDGASIQANLADITGIRTNIPSQFGNHEKNKNSGEAVTLLSLDVTWKVPQVFINGNCVGGGSDVKALHQSGKLESMLIG